MISVFCLLWFSISGRLDADFIRLIHLHATKETKNYLDLLLQPSMEGDKTLCKASIDAEPLGHAASTLAQKIGMD